MHTFLNRKTSLILLAGLLITLAGPVPLRGQKEEKQEGVLRILMAGRQIGTEHYRIRRRGANLEAEADIRMEVNETTVRQKATLTLSAAGEPISYTWRMEQPQKITVRVEFEGAKASVTYPKADGELDKQEFHFPTGRVAILDNNVFHHFALAARLYDFQAGGQQEVPVLIPQSVQPGTLLLEAKGKETVLVKGKSILARRLDVTSTDNMVQLWLGENNELLRLEVPSSGVVVEPEP